MGIQDRDYYQDESSGMQLDFQPQSMVIKLIIINVVIFFVNLFTSTPEHRHWLMNAMASHPSNLQNPLEWWKLLGSGFAHDPQGVTHILFNMVGLYFLGRDVEDRTGRKEFLAFYLTTIVFANIVSALRYQFFVPVEQWRGGLGASGGVIGVAILYAFYFPHRKLLFMLVIPMPAWVLAVLFVLVDTFGVGERIAHDVHLAGAAFGALYALTGIKLTALSQSFKNRRPKLRVVKHESDEELEREGDRLLDKVHREGEQSLTAKERKLLERYSRYKRRQRDTSG